MPVSALGKLFIESKWMCTKCGGDLHAYNLLSTRLRTDQLQFCDLCVLELERNDVSYRKNRAADSGQTYADLLKQGLQR